MTLTYDDFKPRKKLYYEMSRADPLGQNPAGVVDETPDQVFQRVQRKAELMEELARAQKIVGQLAKQVEYSDDDVEAEMIEEWMERHT